MEVREEFDDFDIVFHAGDDNTYRAVLKTHLPTISDVEGWRQALLQQLFNYRDLFEEEYKPQYTYVTPRGYEILSSYDEHRRMERPQARASADDGSMALPRPVHGRRGSLELYDYRCHDHVLPALHLEGYRTVRGPDRPDEHPVP